MKKQYRETNGELALEDVSMAAALMGSYFDEQGKKHQGLKFLRIQDTPFSDSKEIILKKPAGKNFWEIVQFYFAKKMRVEPHDYLNKIGELKDLIKARIKQTTGHYVEERKIQKENCDE